VSENRGQDHGVVFLVYLLLRISRMVGGGTRTVVVDQSPHDDRPKLPDRSTGEIQSLLDSMPTEWVTYEGMTPPLRLKVRGMTHELYRRFTRAQLDAFGQDTLDKLPMAQKMEVTKSLLPIINATAYVVDWSGAQYPNGKPLPYTPENLATFLRKDEMLRNFVSNEASRIGPAW
jgi:hypothetical protein